jgi:hypothetical protein
MDRIEEYRQIIERILGEHLELVPKEDQVETLSVCDTAGGHYLLMEIGWQPPRRIHSVVFHIRLKDGKIWIEQDWTEYGVARELLEAGVPPEVIELGFQPPEMRPHIQLVTTPAR